MQEFQGWTEDEILDAHEKVDELCEQSFLDGGCLVLDKRKRGADALSLDKEGQFGHVKVIELDGSETVKRFGEG